MKWIGAVVAKKMIGNQIRKEGRMDGRKKDRQPENIMPPATPGVGEGIIRK